MNKEKQIEEMVNIINSADPYHCRGCEFFFAKQHCYAATVLYNVGYRKQIEGENISQMHPSDEFICEKCGLIIRECCRYEIDKDEGDEICYEFPYRYCPRCGMKVKGE